MKRHPRQLSAGANNAVIALSETEAAKLFVEDTRSEIGSEARKMRFANGVNDLVCRFISLDYHEALQAEMLVIERIHPLDFRGIEFEKRELLFKVFADELGALHSAGFVHRDLHRPSGLEGQYFDNILLTVGGLRLIDLGVSAIREEVGERLFAKFVEREAEELALFKEYFLNR